MGTLSSKGTPSLGFPGSSGGKESTCNSGDLGWIPGLGRSPGGGHGNPLQYSCLENPKHRGARRATVHGMAESEMPQHNAQHSVATPSLLTEQAQIWRTILKTHPRDAMFHCRLSGSEGPLRAYTTSSHFQLSRPVVPNLFGTSFAEDNFSMNQGARDAFRMIQVHYIYCVLYFYCYYVSSTSDHQALGPRDCRPML